MLALVTLGFSGAFTVYTYIGPITHAAAGIGTLELSGILLVYGVGSIIGNMVGGIGADRWRPRIVVLLGVSGVGIALLCLAALAATGPTMVVALVLLLATIILWSVSAWTIIPSNQKILVSHAPDAPSVVLAFGASANYAGIALGGMLGGITLEYISTPALGVLGGAIEALTVVGLLLTGWLLDVPLHAAPTPPQVKQTSSE
jgi:predicted MFS family arabinose efflux permease